MSGPDPFEGYSPFEQGVDSDYVRDARRPWWVRLPVCVTALGRTAVARRSDRRAILLEEVPEEAPRFPREAWNATLDDLIAAADRDHPMAVPAPRCGQVWWFGGGHHQVLSVSGGSAVFVGWRQRGERILGGVMVELGVFETPWPPPEGVLVAGPGAPWAPPGWQRAASEPSP